MRAAAVLCIVGCGRIDFVPLAQATMDGPELPACDADDFSDGVGDGWFDDNGRWIITTGPTGPAWQTQFGGATFTYRVPNPLYDEVDFEVDATVGSLAFGDFFLQLINSSGRTYQLTLHPSGSDDPTDTLARLDQTTVVLDAAPNRIAASTWSRMRLVRDPGGIRLFVDGAEHLSSTDTTFGPPYAVDVGFNGGGAIDNVRLHCR
jgi:hypothetical protein